MKFMGWGPADLGYRAATQGHVDAILELMEEEAAEFRRLRGGI